MNAGMIDTPRAIVSLWPSAEALASDIGTTGEVVRKWAQRDGIPGRYWAALVDAAMARGISGVTLEILAGMHDVRPLSAEAEGARS